MRVGLNLLYLVPGETGGRETYARELVPAMCEQAPQIEWVAFVNRDAGAALAGELGAGVRAVAIPVSARNRPQWALGELALVSIAARRARVDVLHSMANFAPPWGPFGRVVTIHDLQYRAVPEALSWPMRAATSALVRLAAHTADRIVAVSNAGRDEIIAGLGIERGRIDVIPNGVRPAVPVSPGDGARERYRLEGRPVVLAVATNLPHKNLPALVEALSLFEPTQRPVLVIAGHDSDNGELAARARAAAVGDDVRLLGARTTAELESLYALADCFVLPTLHEGFGLPVLEAMARGVPVACSAIPALQEVAGDAALYFDPRKPVQIAQRIGELLHAGPTAALLRERGPLRAAGFSWSLSARRTLASYRSALGS
jgi:glycosyltransferase involved in cell wall biosynthesis